VAARLEGGNWILPATLALTAAAVGVLAGADPRLAIAAALGVAFVIVAFADLTAGLALFVFIAFLEPVPIGGPVLSFTKIAGLLLFLSWLGVATARSATVNPARGAWALMGALLAWIILSTTWAESTGDTLSAFYRWALNGMLFVLVASAVNERRDALWLATAFVAGATAAGLYGLATPGSVSSELSRAETAGLDPNQLAGVLVPGLVLSMFAALSPRTPSMPRLLAIIAGAICLGATVLTLSRGGLIALGAALVVALLVGGRMRGRVLVAAVVLSFGVFTYFNSVASPDARMRITETTQGEARLQEGRSTIWQVGWRMFEANSVRGVGAGNFQTASIHYVLAPGAAGRTDLVVDEPSAAHNTYLEVLAELGVAGGALFAAVLGLSAWSLLSAARRFRRAGDETLRLLSQALLAALAGTLVSDFFISNQFGKVLWLLLGLGPALLAIARREQAATEEAEKAAAAGAAPYPPSAVVSLRS
jgi:O-antigen ligase